MAAVKRKEIHIDQELLNLHIKYSAKVIINCTLYYNSEVQYSNHINDNSKSAHLMSAERCTQLINLWLITICGVADHVTANRLYDV